MLWFLKKIPPDRIFPRSYMDFEQKYQKDPGMNRVKGPQKKKKKTKIQQSEMCSPWEKWRRNVQVKFRQLQYNKSFVRILLIEILCRLGCATGILESVYSRNQFSPTITSFLKPEEVNMARVGPLRTAAKEENMGGGQGVPKCNCTGNCLNARCSCKKESRRCNSRCHNKRSCANVDAFIGWNKP